MAPRDHCYWTCVQLRSGSKSRILPLTRLKFHLELSDWSSAFRMAIRIELRAKVMGKPDSASPWFYNINPSFRAE